MTTSQHTKRPAKTECCRELFNYIIKNQKQINARTLAAKFEAALKEDALIATKIMFFTRDIKWGLGSRDIFTALVKQALEINPEIIRKNISSFPLYGRWDDLYILVDSPLESEMFSMLKLQFNEDLEALKHGKSHVSLLSKWMKSVNASSAETRRLGKKTAQALGLSEKKYRKALSSLRNALDIPEKKMSENKWKEINFDKMGNRCFIKNQSSFFRHNCNCLSKAKKADNVLKKEQKNFFLELDILDNNRYNIITI